MASYARASAVSLHIYKYLHGGARSPKMKSTAVDYTRLTEKERERETIFAALEAQLQLPESSCCEFFRDDYIFFLFVLKNNEFYNFLLILVKK